MLARLQNSCSSARTIIIGPLLLFLFFDFWLANSFCFVFQWPTHFVLISIGPLILFCFPLAHSFLFVLFFIGPLILFCVRLAHSLCSVFEWPAHFVPFLNGPFILFLNEPLMFFNMPVSFNVSVFLIFCVYNCLVLLSFIYFIFDKSKV